MNISTRRRNESLFQRLWHALKAEPERAGVCSDSAFQQELAKEISRANRRQRDREFALVHLSVVGKSGPLQVTQEMANDFLRRMRISDTLGWHRTNLAVLLPETDREGANLVTNDLVKLGIEHGMQLDSTIYIYPWDDDLISVANEIAKSKEQSYSDDDDDQSRGGGRSGEFQRTDRAHQARTQFEGSILAGTEVSGDVQLHAMHRVEVVSEGSDLSGTSSAVLTKPSETQQRPAAAQIVTSPLQEGRPQLACDQEAQLNSLAEKHSTEIVCAAPTPVWKRTIDVVGAATGLVLLSPILAVAAAAIKASSPGPVLFRQKREGKDGKAFEILKFRTMIADAEAKQAALRGVNEQDGPAFKLKDDPRITSVGKVLRKSCVDELPQLVNVLVGQMSLVGPRPLPVSESKACAPWQRMRLTVSPGLTCTWQARGGRKVSFEQWMRMDLEYIKNISFANDVRLIFETALIALMHRGSV